MYPVLLLYVYVHVLHVHSIFILFCSVVETRVGHQAQLHRQEVYEIF